MIGPSIPEHLKRGIQLDAEDGDSHPNTSSASLANQSEAAETTSRKRASVNNADDDSSDDEFGPALPPSFQKQKFASTSEPNERSSYQSTTSADNDNNEPIVGPVFSDLNSDEPVSKRPKTNRNDNSTKKVVREEWMTMVPEVLTKNFGSGPRKFDTSSRSKIPIDADEAERASRDFEQERIARELSSVRQDSLLDSHRKDKDEKSKVEIDESEKVERVPFDRERDMKSKMLDSEAKNKLIKNCQGFSSRFASSKTSKYL